MMAYSGFHIHALSFHGPETEPAVVLFQPGLNVIYGASDTGKSYIVEAVDFMLGGKGPLPDIPQAHGYNQALLAIAFNDGSELTIQRAMAGGQFKVFEGLFTAIPEAEGIVLSDMHSERDRANLSYYLLEKIGLSGRRIRKNARDETQALSFRNLARLVVVNEEEIIQKRSPLSDGNAVANTANTSVFTMLLAGLDDRELSPRKTDSAEDQKRLAQIELLDQLIATAQKRIATISGSKDELSQQEDRITKSLESRVDQLALTEDKFKVASAKRRNLFQRIETATDRLSEIGTLIDRFNLLQHHYASDYERLLAIKEAGGFFSVIEEQACPTCGAAPEHHDPLAACHEEVDVAVAAAESEMQKIEARQSDLATTILSLKAESKTFQRSLPNLRTALTEVSTELETAINPDLRKQRASYKELADKGAGVREALGLFSSLSDLLGRKQSLEALNHNTDKDRGSYNRLTDSLVAKFSKLVEDTLIDWTFPGANHVHFDTTTKDLVISGKARTSYGKGLRAITQSAFSICLMEYCAQNNLPHPGFVILDSPLLSYREPDSAEDDLRDTNLNGNFYRYLLGLKADRQVIIVENTDPPSDVELGSRAIHFSGMLHEERMGLFP